MKKNYQSMLIWFMKEKTHPKRGRKFNVRKDQCKFCSVIFSSKKNLMMHVDVVHPVEKSFKCEICEYSQRTWAHINYNDLFPFLFVLMYISVIFLIFCGIYLENIDWDQNKTIENAYKSKFFQYSSSDWWKVPVHK